MSGEGHENPDEPWRQRYEEQQHRRYPYQQQQRHLNVITLFDRLGYNLYDDDEVKRLDRNLRFSEEARERRERFDSNKWKWVVGAMISLFGSGLTLFFQYVGKK